MMKKAYAIYDRAIEPLEGNSMIVFSLEKDRAIRWFCCNFWGEFDEEYLDSIVVERAPNMDKYRDAPGEIPK